MLISDNLRAITRYTLKATLKPILGVSELELEGINVLGKTWGFITAVLLTILM